MVPGSTPKAAPLAKHEPGPEGESDMLWDLVTEALAPLVQGHRLPDGLRVTKKIRDYFRKAGKAVAFGRKPWGVLLQQFADNVFFSLFNSIGDEEWFMEVDFLLILDAAVRENFPEEVLRGVSQPAYEVALMEAHDRSFCEQRLQHVAREVVWDVLRGEKTRKRVHTALVESWNDVRQNGAFGNTNLQADMEAFTKLWIKGSTTLLDGSAGDLEWILPEDSAQDVFAGILERGAACHVAPYAGGSAPSDLTFVGGALRDAYSACETASAKDHSWHSAGKRRRASQAH